MPQRVLVADDHPIIRDALGAALRSLWPDHQIDEAACVQDARALAAEGQDYRLVTLDLLLPDAEGFSGLVTLRKSLPRTPIAIVTSRQDAAAVSIAHTLGAGGFLSKSSPMSRIAADLERIARGERVFPSAAPMPTKPSTTITRKQLDALSAAQLRTLLALADGRINKRIAADMRVSEATVKAHLAAAYKKLGVANRGQAIIAIQPLLSPGG